MTQANFENAETEAFKLLSKYKISEPPVRIDEIIEKEGLNVIEADFGDESNSISGLINPDEKTIYVNQKESDNRQAFTIAHELGHWLLHQPQLTKNKDIGIMYRKSITTLNDDPLEKEANSLKDERSKLEKDIAEKNAKLQQCAKDKAETKANLEKLPK